MAHQFATAVQDFTATLASSKEGRYAISPSLRNAMLSVEGSVSVLLQNPSRYKIKSSVGAGNWANVAWITALDTEITNTPQEGYYLSMLFTADLTNVYVGIGLGVSNFQNSHLVSIEETVQLLREALRDHVLDPAVIWDGEIDFGIGGRLPDGYKRATVVTKKFEVANLPDDTAMTEYITTLVDANDIALPVFRQIQARGKETRQSLPVHPSVSNDLDSDLHDLLWDYDLGMELLDLWGRKKNLILQGSPGVGKTFWSEAICERANEAAAYSSPNLVGMDAPNHTVFRCQFHQSMSYEDFVEGFRPTKDGGFDLVDGIFMKAVENARENPSGETVIVIDEINRGNISKIFGELLSLIEADKRSSKWAVTLPYSGRKFWVPPNLYILGMMNTADRSISLVDYALRRRFGFIDVMPAFDRPQFTRLLLQRGIGLDTSSLIVRKLTALNEVIASTPQLGQGFQIGHSYFIPNETAESELPADVARDWYQSVVKYEVKPLIQEYWFDDPTTADDLVAQLLS